ncbi:efflux RND transporter periplasmic adaptor subunit [bacterium]|nr:efflux RND transporter periplasmic adaptor subunit [bacterium]
MKFYRAPVLVYGIVAVSIATASMFCGCTKGGDGQRRSRSAPKYAVEIATVESHKVDFTVLAVGSVEAFEIVPVTARVQGVVEKVLFREGDAVRTGTPLVEVEPERYRLMAQSAEAQFEKAKASLQEAKMGLARRMDIQQKNRGLVSPEEVEEWQTRVRTLKADSAYALSKLDEARLNQRDSRIPAPAGGVIQNRMVNTGQFVQQGAVIATLVRRDPLLLRFMVPEQDAQRLRIKMPVRFRVRDDETEYSAVITAITESADPVTRMVTVTAEVTDENRAVLRPGVFVEVTVLLGESAELPLIPQTSIRPSERGFLAFVVDDSIAYERVLTLGMRSLNGLVEVRNGVRDGEKIVVRGAEALYDGAPVHIAKVSEISSTATSPSDSIKEATQ